MNILRRIVSGKKNRYEDDGFNLDLTYITPRIIAMSLPGEGVHKMYRNSINSVSRFLNEKHKGNYKIFNLSGLKYDYDKFGGCVKEYPWADHFPPPIELLFHACHEMFKWLDLNIENVVAVNCKAGKGRTGTLICCYLLYSGRFTSPDQALRYYKQKRFSTGGGVTQPSQVRYVHYFALILHGRIKSPLLLQLTCIRIKTAPHMSSNGCRPVIEITQNNRMVYSNKKPTRDKQSILTDDWEENKIHELALINTEIILQGDTNCFLYHWSQLKMKKICRFSFNTAFIFPEHEIVFNKYELDPDAFQNNKKVSDGFAVFLEFMPVCKCASSMPISERCELCLLQLNSREKDKWNDISNVLLERIVLNPSQNLFGREKDDIEEYLYINIHECVFSSDESND